MLSQREWITLLAIVTMAVCGAVVVAHTTALYPRGGRDSVAYIVSARNLLGGDGLGMWMASGRFAPLTHFPPLYPLVLAAAGTMTGDLLLAARWIDILLIGAAILVAAWIAWDATRSGLVAIAVGFLILTSSRLLISFSSAMSEPLFIVLGLLSLGLAIVASRTESRGILLGSALAASLATLTRYAGVGLIPAGALTVALLRPGPWRSRLAWGGLYLAIAFIPLAGWSIVQRAGQGGELPRVLALEAGNLWELLGPFRGDLATWGWYLIPGSDYFLGADWRIRLLTFAALILLPLAVVGLAVLRNRDWRRDPELARLVRLSSAAVLFVASYLGGLAAAFLLASPRPDIEQRMLLPLQIPIWLAVVATILMLFQLLGHRLWAVGGLLIAMAALVLSQAPGAWSTIEDLHAGNNSLTTPDWRDSAMITFLQGLPPSTGIVTNESALVLLWADRPAYDLPALVPDAPRKTSFRRFGDDTGDPIEVLFRDDRVVLAVFDTISPQLARIYEDAAPARLRAMLEGLDVVYEGPGGTIYSYPR